MAFLRQGSYGRKVVCGLSSLVLVTLAACTTSQTNRQPSATAARSPTATATVSLATAHSEWTVLPNPPADATNITFAPSNPRLGLLCTSVDRVVPSAQPKLYKTTD